MLQGAFKLPSNLFGGLDGQCWRVLSNSLLIWFIAGQGYAVHDQLQVRDIFYYYFTTHLSFFPPLGDGSTCLQFCWLGQSINFCLSFSILFTRGGSVVECRAPEREIGGSKPTATVLFPWARHFTPRKYWLIAQEAVALSRHHWKIVDWDVKPQHKQTPHSYCNII